MFKNMVSKYTDPKHTKTFDDYDYIYAEKIIKKFATLNNDNVHSQDFYNSYFKDFSTKSTEIAKLFSSLKHK